MQPFIDSLDGLKKEFVEVVLTVERQVELANAWIAEHSDDDRDEIPPREKLSEMQASDAATSTRSIFDDVDE